MARLQAREKLEEARYFLGEMRRVKDNPTQFTYELSAFLSAARSVDYYLRQEATGNPALQKWLDGIFARVKKGVYPNTPYFIDKRDFNIHVRMIDPKPLIKLTVIDTPLMITESVSITRVDQAGNVLESSSYTEPRPPESSLPEPTMTRVDTYHFEDRLGEDLFDTCQAYLDELTQIVEEAEKVVAGQP